MASGYERSQPRHAIISTSKREWLTILRQVFVDAAAYISQVFILGDAYKNCLFPES